MRSLNLWYWIVCTSKIEIWTTSPQPIYISIENCCLLFINYFLFFSRVVSVTILPSLKFVISNFLKFVVSKKYHFKLIIAQIYGKIISEIHSKRFLSQSVHVVLSQFFLHFQSNQLITRKWLWLFVFDLNKTFLFHFTSNSPSLKLFNVFFSRCVFFKRVSPTPKMRVCLSRLSQFVVA